MGRGDPSAATARTVFGAIRVGVRFRLGTEDLSDVTVGVQGAGHVGSTLVKLLRQAGAQVEVTDVARARAEAVADRTGARAVSPDRFAQRLVDVFAPCAFGEVISPNDIGALRCKVIAGAANNPLSTPDLADALAARGILYVPDFLANCGGIIHVGAEALALTGTRVEHLLEGAIARIERILDLSVVSGRRPLALAYELAERKLAGRSTVEILPVGVTA